MINLNTSDVAAAKRKRDDLEALTKLQFLQSQAGKRDRFDIPGWAVENGKRTTPADRGSLSREALLNASESDELELIYYAAEQERDRLKPSERRVFDDAFSGRVAPDHYLEDYLSKASLAPKTTKERRGLIGRFAVWCREKGVKLERVDRRLAGRYVSEAIDPMHPATQNKHLIALRGYWVYLAQRGLVDLPPGVAIGSGWPWNGQQVKKRGKRAERG